MLGPVQQFSFGVNAITCHAWNKERTQIALSPNNHEVHIYVWRQGKWDRAHILAEHDLPITGIDWAPNSNRIVTCSQDKNAFVWTFDGKAWKPELVLVRFSRAATCVKWSPNENKFAVGSGAKMISVCYYDKENNWWLSKHIRKPIRSTVTCIDWHPNNVLLAAGSCDFKTRVFSAFVKEVDDKFVPSPWGTKVSQLGTAIAEFSSGVGGWVHCVKFSPSGNRLAWCGHDSSVSVVDSCDQSNAVLNGAAQSTNRVPRIGSLTTLKDWWLPFTSIEWMTENSLVAAGHDCCPMLFSFVGVNQLKFVSKLDVPSEDKAGGKTTAMQRFKEGDKKGSGDFSATLKTLHQNSISQISAHSGARENVLKFSSCGVDGQLILWDLKETIEFVYQLQQQRQQEQALQSQNPTMKVA